MSKIIIFHDKHGDLVYDASTNDALALSCASIIKDRYEGGWYSEDDAEWEDIERLMSADTLEETLNFRGPRSVSLAFAIISARMDYEYEDYDVEEVMEPTW